jgi:outer membrane murein-binding lipoprotein Lpp
MVFNALRSREELEEAGFSHHQAEATVKVLIDMTNENFATKADVSAAVQTLNAKIDLGVQTLNAKIDSSVQMLDSKIEKLDTKIETGLREMEYKLTIKLGTLMTLAIGVTATVVKLLESAR